MYGYLNNKIFMNIDKIPVVGKVNKTLNRLMINFVLLAVIFIILGLMIIFIPQALDVLAASLLFVSALIFFNIAYNFWQYKKKLEKFFHSNN